MTASKGFPIYRERVHLTYRAEFFNILNHTNLQASANSVTMSSGQFGQLTAAAAARVIQMTLRVDF
jgi:hypothetical protein